MSMHTMNIYIQTSKKARQVCLKGYPFTRGQKKGLNK